MIELFTENTIFLIITLCVMVYFVFLRVIFQQKREIFWLNQLSQKDELTHAYTRRYFFEILEYHLKLSHRYNSFSAILMIDIDNFKEINDSFGHLFGDDVLIHVAKECNEQLRESDILARYGGDEFILLCPFIEYDDVVVVVQRIQKALQNYDALPISISVGAHLFSKTSNTSEIVQCADEALYCAKKNGKNRLEFFTA